MPLSNEILELLMKLARSGGGVARSQALRDELMSAGKFGAGPEGTQALNQLLGRVRANPGDLEAMARLRAGISPGMEQFINRPQPVPTAPKPKLASETIMTRGTDPAAQGAVEATISQIVKRRARQFAPPTRQFGNTTREPNVSRADLENVGQATAARELGNYTPEKGPLENILGPHVYRDIARYTRAAKRPVSQQEPATPFEREMWQYIDRFRDKYGHTPSDVLVGHRFKIAPSIVRGIREGRTKVRSEELSAMTPQQIDRLERNVQRTKTGARRLRSTTEAPGATGEIVREQQDPLARLIQQEQESTTINTFYRALDAINPESKRLLILHASGDPVTAQAKAAGMSRSVYYRALEAAQNELKQATEKLGTPPKSVGAGARKTSAADYDPTRDVNEYARFVNKGDPRPGREPDPHIIQQLMGGMTKQNQPAPGWKIKPNEHPEYLAAVSALENEVRLREMGRGLDRHPGPDRGAFPSVRSEAGAGYSRPIMELIEEIWPR